MTGAPTLLVHDGHHGVAVFGRELAAACRAADPATRTVDVAGLAGLRDGARVHVQFTDRLWGASPEEAADAFRAVAERLRVSVTLHDVPQASDGERNRIRRGAAYAEVAEAASGVAVNSAHERMLLGEERVWSGPAVSIPLPVTMQPESPRPHGDGAIGVLGFFYPGKGHDEAARAALAAGIPRLVVLGRASEGHAAELETFVRRAEADGLAVEVTGWLEEGEIARRGRAVSVPVIAHRHVSASGSLASWIGWGRRPVAVRNRYIDEMAALRPGTLTVADDGHLAAAVRRVADRPDLSWHGFDRLPMAWPDAARSYAQWWNELPA